MIEIIWTLKATCWTHRGKSIFHASFKKMLHKNIIFVNNLVSNIRNFSPKLKIINGKIFKEPPKINYLKFIMTGVNLNYTVFIKWFEGENCERFLYIYLFLYNNRKKKNNEERNN